MQTAAISPANHRPLQLALQYWERHWDFECPTLFGIEHEQLRDVLSSWPTVPEHLEEIAGLALLGSLRELLYGASAVPHANLPGLIGLSYAQADELCTQIHSIVQSTA